MHPFVQFERKCGLMATKVCIDFRCAPSLRHWCLGCSWEYGQNLCCRYCDIHNFDFLNLYSPWGLTSPQISGCFFFFCNWYLQSHSACYHPLPMSHNQSDTTPANSPITRKTTKMFPSAFCSGPCKVQCKDLGVGIHKGPGPKKFDT